MAVREIPCILVVAQWGSTSLAGTPIAPAAGMTQVGDFESARCGSIALPESVLQYYYCFVTIPPWSSVTVSLYDVDGAATIVTSHVQHNTSLYHRRFSFFISPSRSWGNFPAGDARIQPRYTLIDNYGGPTNGAYHSGLWWVIRGR